MNKIQSKAETVTQDKINTIEDRNAKIKSLIKETLYNSLSQAIIKIIESPYFTLKSFLLICVLASSGICSYLILELILYYFSFGVNTTTRTLYETPALFPKVTICNVNPFTTQYSMEFIKKVNKELYPNIDIFNENQMNQLNFTYKSVLINVIYRQAKAKMNKLNETEKRKLSHSLDDIMSDCSFNIQPCSANDFKWFFEPFYGNCWIFNSGLNESSGKKAPLLFSSFPGEIYGFQIKLYVNFYKNLSIFNSYFGGLGVLIRIDNSSYLTSYIGTEGIKIEPGSMTSVSLRRFFKTTLSKPYSDCLIDNQTNSGFQSELFNLIQNSAYRYTQPTCFLQCMQRFILSECNCTNSNLISLFTNSSQCSLPKQTTCMSSLFTTLKIFKNDFFQKNCLEDCPFECNYNQFDFSSSSYKLLPDVYLSYLESKPNLTSDFFSNEINAETARESFISLNIFYETLSYDISSESPQLALITLFANVGGYLGLFLGVSVFSLFEIIQVFIEIIFIKLRKS